MNTLHQAVQDYLKMRRDLGFKLREAGDGLLEFAAFMRRRHAAYITSEVPWHGRSSPEMRRRPIGRND